MPEPVQPERRAAERSVAERATDHAAIADSIDELLPALIAKLGATGLAELEVREDALRVRLRRPADGGATHDRRAADRAGRGDRARGPVGTTSTHGSGPAAVGPGHDGRERVQPTAQPTAKPCTATAMAATPHRATLDCATTDAPWRPRPPSASTSLARMLAPARRCAPAIGSGRSTCSASPWRSSPRRTA